MTDQTVCETCGSALGAGSSFCGRCGAAATPLEVTAPIGSPPPPVHEAASDPSDPPDLSQRSTASSPRVVSRSVVGLAALAVVGLVAGIGALVIANQRTTDRLHAEEARRRKTARELSGTREELVDTEQTLAMTEGKLTRTADALDVMTEERDTAEDELLWANTQLEGVRNSLGNANDQIDGQSQLIDDLRVCLGGVLNALSDSAYGDYSSALAQLNAVEATCQAANDAL